MEETERNGIMEEIMVHKDRDVSRRTQTRYSDLVDADNLFNPLVDTEETIFMHRALCAYAVVGCPSDCSGSRKGRKHALLQIVRNQ